MITQFSIPSTVTNHTKSRERILKSGTKIRVLNRNILVGHYVLLDTCHGRWTVFDVILGIPISNQPLISLLNKEISFSNLQEYFINIRIQPNEWQIINNSEFITAIYNNNV